MFKFIYKLQQIYIENSDLKLFVDLTLNNPEISANLKEELMNQVGRKNFSRIFDYYVWIGKRNAVI